MSLESLALSADLPTSTLNALIATLYTAHLSLEPTKITSNHNQRRVHSQRIKTFRWNERHTEEVLDVTLSHSIQTLLVAVRTRLAFPQASVSTNEASSRHESGTTQMFRTWYLLDPRTTDDVNSARRCEPCACNALPTRRNLVAILTSLLRRPE